MVIFCQGGFWGEKRNILLKGGMIFFFLKKRKKDTITLNAGVFVFEFLNHTKWLKLV